VTGVQTCALPISVHRFKPRRPDQRPHVLPDWVQTRPTPLPSGPGQYGSTRRRGDLKRLANLGRFPEWNAVQASSARGAAGRRWHESILARHADGSRFGGRALWSGNERSEVALEERRKSAANGLTARKDQGSGLRLPSLGSVGYVNLGVEVRFASGEPLVSDELSLPVSSRQTAQKCQIRASEILRLLPTPTV